MISSEAAAHSSQRAHFLLRAMRTLIVTAAAAALSACGVLGVHSCGPVLGADDPRIRSTDVRMKLAHPSAAARRLAPYALISALAYADYPDDHCSPTLVSEADRKELEGLLQETADRGAFWERISSLESGGQCENDKGFAYRVWKRASADGVEVVIAFRGTSDSKDWKYGNLHWWNRLVRVSDQYSDAWAVTPRVVAQIKRDFPTGKIRLVSTGHSLGGGLAQAVLYAQPEDFSQAITFDPSAVTGFADQPAASRVGEQTYLPDSGEARIYRVYESSEILSWLRTPHKLFFGPPHWVNEVRFGFDSKSNSIAQHSMAALAKSLARRAKENEDEPSPREPWYAGSGKGCTEQFERQR